jgi:hypothetical protein
MGVDLIDGRDDAHDSASPRRTTLHQVAEGQLRRVPELGIEIGASQVAQLAARPATTKRETPAPFRMESARLVVRRLVKLQLVKS